jgi:hypothetical protein
LAHAFLWEHSYKRLKLARLLGRHGALLTLPFFFKPFVASTNATHPGLSWDAGARHY